MIAKKDCGPRSAWTARNTGATHRTSSSSFSLSSISSVIFFAVAQVRVSLWLTWTSLGSRTPARAGSPASGTSLASINEWDLSFEMMTCNGSRIFHRIAMR